MSKRVHLEVNEASERLPILIIDKGGLFAGALVEKLKDQFFIVLVADKEIASGENIAHVSYGKKMPMLPDVEYRSIIVIYHGENNTLDIFPELLKKASEVNAKLVFITSFRYVDHRLKQIMSSVISKNLTFIIYGELFGNNSNEENVLMSFVNQVRSSNSITIPGNGLHKVYPINYEDALEAIFSVLFVMPLKHRIINLAPEHGYTLLTLSRLFQKIDPLIKVGFSKEKNSFTECSFPQDGIFYFKKYDLDSKIKKMDLSKKDTSFNKEPKKQKEIVMQKKFSIYNLLFLFIAFFIIPIFLEIVLFLTGGLLLADSFRKVERYDLEAAQRDAILSRSAFASAVFMEQNLAVANPILFQFKESVIQKAQSCGSLAEIESDLLSASKTMLNIYKGKSIDPKNDFFLVTSKIKNSLVGLRKLGVEGGLPKKVLSKIEPLEPSLSLIENTIDVYPDILGFNGARKYLILFQNNMELRPGGGFIGSYATVTVNNGKMGKLEIHDVYDADGKLSVHIEPPFPLRRYLGVSHWFMRDSNSDVNFLANAKQAQKFLSLETGEKTDGVIAIDTDFIKSIISMLGTVYVPDFKETVTADNFYILTENHAEKNFFPGSSQKRDFLRALFSALQNALADMHKVPFTHVIENMTDMIKQKHLLIALPDNENQVLFSANNMSGSLQDNRSITDNELADFLEVSESNLGANKSNYYLQRSIEQRVVLKENSGIIEESVTISYANASIKDSPYGGDYKNYLSLVLPGNAVLKSVEVNGIRLATISAITDYGVYAKPGFVPPPQLEVEKKIQEGKAIYGFPLIVPRGTSEKVTVNYILPSSFDWGKAMLTYDNYISKQPGTKNDSYRFSLIYPSALQIAKSSPGLVDVGGKTVYSGNLNEDIDLNIKFGKR